MTLVSLSELVKNILFLKTAHVLVIGLGEIKLVLTWKPPS